MKKVIGIVLIVVFAFLVITNPSMSAFKASHGDISFKNSENVISVGPSRVANLFLFSFYETRVSSMTGSQKLSCYLGIAGNFFEISKPQSP